MGGKVILGSHLLVPLFGSAAAFPCSGIPVRVLRMDRFLCFSRKVQIPETGHICVFLETSRIQGCKCVPVIAKPRVSAVG